MGETITVETFIQAPMEKVWQAFTEPEAVMRWNAASENWHCPNAANDLRDGGNFSYRMEAKDGTAGFDFTGTYDTVKLHELISYTMDDGRKVAVSFLPEGEGVLVVETFDPETENSLDLQRQGWQAILDSFKQYVENEAQV